MKRVRLWFKKYFNILTGKGKPSRKLIRAAEGSVTILLTVIMLPMLVFSFSVLDLCKIFLAKDIIESTTDLALRSALTSYDDVLKDMYGIFASSKSDKELTENVANYYAATLSSCGIEVDDAGATLEFIQGIFGTELDEEMNNNNNFLKVFPGGEIDGKVYAPISVSGLPESAVSNPDVLRRQIVEYMKYRGPITMAAGLFDKINAFKDLPNQANVVDKQIEYEKTASDVGNNVIKAYTLLQVYKYNNEVLMGNKDAGKILDSLYALDEKKDIIDGNKLVFNDDFKLDTLKKDNKVFDEDLKHDSIRSYVSHLEISAVYVTSIYDYIPTLRDNGKLEILSLSASTKPNYDHQGKMEEAHDEIINANKTSDMGMIYKIIDDGLTKKRLDRLKSFIVNCVYNTLDGEEYAETYRLLKNFVTMYECSGTQPAETDFSQACKQFLSNYEWLVEKNEAPDEKYKNLYDKIKAAEDTVKEYVEEFYNSAKSEFDYASELLNKLYDDMSKQVGIIDELLDYETTFGFIDKCSLEGIYQQFQKAKQDAQNYKEAIDKVQNQSQKNSNLALYESEAQDFSVLNRGDVDKMIAALTEQKKVYTEAMSAIESIIFLKDTDGGYGIIDTSKKGSEHRRYTEFKNYLKKITRERISGKDFFYTVRSVEGNGGEVVYYKGFDGAKVGNYENWRQFFSKVTDNDSNPFYKKLEELSKPTDGNTATEEGKNLKKTVTEKAKTDDDGNPSTDDNSSLPSSSESVDDDKNDALDPTKITKFSETEANGKELPGSNLSGGNDDKGMAKKTQSLLKSLQSYLSDLGKNLGDSILVSEYFIEQFSCYTTNMDGKGNRGTEATMLSGYKFCEDDKTSNVAWYGAEQEYILYGKDTPGKNIAAASASIYAIRFVLNLIYSFTDSEITSFTTSVATAAGGIFPLSIPLIKTALHIGLSLAESAYDLKLLKDGATVPLYKTSNTWMCKGTRIVREIAADAVEGIANEVIDAAADKVNELIDKGADKINDFRTDMRDEFEQLLNEELEKLRSQVKTDIILPLELAIQKCVINFGNSSDIRGKLKTALQDACETTREQLGLENTPDKGNALKTAEKKVLDFVEGNIGTYADKVADKIDDYINVAMGIDSEEVSDGNANKNLGKFSQKLEQLFNDAINKVGEAVKAVEGTISDALNEALNALVTKAKDGVKLGANAAKDAIHNVSNDIRGQGHLNTKITDAKDKTSTASLIGMSYQDYLTIFMIISVTTGDTNQLERAAQLMTVNVRKVSGDMKYDLNNTYTLFKAESTASVRTVFYGAIFEDGKLKMPDNSGKYSFRYVSYLGY